MADLVRPYGHQRCPWGHEEQRGADRKPDRSKARREDARREIDEALAERGTAFDPEPPALDPVLARAIAQMCILKAVAELLDMPAGQARTLARSILAPVVAALAR